MRNYKRDIYLASKTDKVSEITVTKKNCVDIYRWDVYYLGKEGRRIPNRENKLKKQAGFDNPCSSYGRD